MAPVTKTKRRGETYTAEQKAEYRRKQAEQQQELIGAGLAQLQDSDGWRAWLEFLSSFHDYSFRNQLLIQVQSPGATLVAGFKQWQSRGRQVRKGQKAIYILRPNPVIIQGADGQPEVDKDGKPKLRMFFKSTPVFDLSQTDPIEGREIVVIDGGQGGAAELVEVQAKLADGMSGRGWTVRVEPIEHGGAKGYCTMDGTKQIVVDSRGSVAQQLKTLAHETAHALLHADLEGVLPEDVPAAEVRELEAESVAYTVCHAYDLDTSDYSLSYLASWGADDAALKASGERIRKTAHAIIDMIEAGAEEVA